MEILNLIQNKKVLYTRNKFPILIEKNLIISRPFIDERMNIYWDQ